MDRSVLLGDDEQQAMRTIIADALLRQSPELDAQRLVEDAVARLGTGEIPAVHAEFHAFASGALYEAVTALVGSERADSLMGDVGRMWRLVSLHQQTRSQPPPDEPGAELLERTVLVVDDDPLAVRALARALPDYGARIVTAHDASSAMSAVQNQTFDAIIADYDMPGESGATLATMIALAMGDQAPPVICLTGVTPLPQSSGFHAVLAKPTHPAQIVSAVLEALEERAKPPPESTGR